MPATLAQKFQLKSGVPVILLNPPLGYLDRLKAELTANPVYTEVGDQAGVIILFVNNLAEAKNLVPQVIQAPQLVNLLWIAYPKGASKVKTDVNRDILWKAVKPMGWRPVRLISLDEVWSVMRYRPEQ
jgi:hypothetical protein